MLAREQVEEQIKLASRFETVDSILNDTYCMTVHEKLDYLFFLYGDKVFDAKVQFKDGGTLEDDYRTLVEAILKLQD